MALTIVLFQLLFWSGLGKTSLDFHIVLCSMSSLKWLLHIGNIVICQNSYIICDVSSSSRDSRQQEIATLRSTLSGERNSMRLQIFLSCVVLITLSLPEWVCTLSIFKPEINWMLILSPQSPMCLLTVRRWAYLCGPASTPHWEMSGLLISSFPSLCLSRSLLVYQPQTCTDALKHTFGVFSQRH